MSMLSFQLLWHFMCIFIFFFSFIVLCPIQRVPFLWYSIALSEDKFTYDVRLMNCDIYTEICLTYDKIEHYDKVHMQIFIHLNFKIRDNSGRE